MRNYKYTVFTSIIEENIKKGILKHGDRLPSVRNIKKEYKLSLSSVQSGYDYLIFKGLVKSNPRSGYLVDVKIAKREAQNLSNLDTLPKNAVFREHVMLTSHRKNYEDIVSLNAAVPSDLLIPQKLILRTMQQTIREKGAALLRYYPTNGSLELRKKLSQRSAQHGALVDDEEIIITDGALQALYIALAVTTNPQDIVAVESPCVFSVLEVIANLHLKVIEIPVTNEDGFDAGFLRNVCTKNEIKAIVVTPNFHNPTGIMMSDEKKKEIYKIALQHTIPIIENDIYGDLYFNGSRPSTIRNFDTQGLVLTYASFSKTIAPGIRLGWLAGGSFFSKAERLKFSLGRSVSPLNQEVITKLLSTSTYDRHLRTFRRQLEHQSILISNQLNQFFPDNSYTSFPQGGYSLWTRLPSTLDMKVFYANCNKFGINFTPGDTFSFTENYDHHFRTVFSQHITSSTLDSIKKIGTSLKS